MDSKTNKSIREIINKIGNIGGEIEQEITITNKEVPVYFPEIVSLMQDIPTLMSDERISELTEDEIRLVKNTFTAANNLRKRCKPRIARIDSGWDVAIKYILTLIKLSNQVKKNVTFIKPDGQKIVNKMWVAASLKNAEHITINVK